MERSGSATWPVLPRGSGRALREPAEIEWSRGDASNIDGQTERSNGAFGKSDIEGKTAREAASELGKERVSSEREHMSQSREASEFQLRSAGRRLTKNTSLSRFVPRRAFRAPHKARPLFSQGKREHERKR